MCKFCNYSEGNVADEDIINKQIRIGEIPDTKYPYYVPDADKLKVGWNYLYASFTIPTLLRLIGTEISQEKVLHPQMTLNLGSGARIFSSHISQKEIQSL